MNPFFALLKKDLKGYLDQPTGYVLLVIFIGITAYLFFRDAIVVGEASLRSMFTYLPWILGVFVPAATMRLIAEEQRDGTLELVLTHPIRIWSVVLAKFLAGFIFVSVGIIATVGIPLALLSAGNLDDGAIVAQYLGTLLLVGQFVAIGLFASSLTRNQIIAFIVGLTFVMILLVMGLTYVTTALPSAIAIFIQDFSPLTHFSGITRGIIDIRELLYFIFTILLFLSITFLMLRSKTVSHRSPLYRYLQVGMAGMVVMSLLVIWFGGYLNLKLDFTEARQYTLSPASKELLSNLDDYVTVKYFTSKDPPVQLSLTTREVTDFLDAVQSVSKGKVRVIRKNADESIETAKEALQSFILPVQFNIESEGEYKVKIGYLGIGMTYTNHQEALQYIDSVDGLEYQFIAAITRMTNKTPTRVGFLAGNGEKRKDIYMKELDRWLVGAHELVEISTELMEYDFSNIDVLILAGPTEWTSTVITYDIHDFMAGGGKVLALLDAVQINSSNFTASRNIYNMSDVVGAYGVVLNNDIVADVVSNETVQMTTKNGDVSFKYPYWVRAYTNENAISGGVESVAIPWAASLLIAEPTEETVKAEYIPLLATTESGVIDTDYGDIMPTSEFLAKAPDLPQSNHLLAVAVTGTRCPVMKPLCEPDPSKPFRLIVVSDSDWVTDRMVASYSENVSLAANYVDWLAMDDDLAGIRSKGELIRNLLFKSTMHQNLVQYSNVVGVPALFIVLGIMRVFMRRKLTSKEYASEK